MKTRVLTVSSTLAVRVLQLSLLALAYVGYQAGDPWVGTTAVLALLITLLPALLARNRNLKMNTTLVLAITIAVALHTVGTIGGYRQVVWFDDVAHVTSASVVAALGYATARSLDVHSEQLRLTPAFTFFYLLVFVMAAGVVWELLEFVVVFLTSEFGLPSRRLQTGLDDTITDLVYDSIGALLVGLFGTVHLEDAISLGSQSDTSPLTDTDE